MKLQMLGIAGGVAFLAAWTNPVPATHTARRAITYSAVMNGMKSTPSNTESSTGRATLVLDGNKLQYTVSVDKLTGPATMAHIHVGAIGVSGPPVYTFAIKKAASGTLAEGTIDLSSAKISGGTVSGDSLKTLLNDGNAYVNVHTAAHPGGEIRGQLAKQ